MTWNDPLWFCKNSIFFLFFLPPFWFPDDNSRTPSRIILKFSPVISHVWAEVKFVRRVGPFVVCSSVALSNCFLGVRFWTITTKFLVICLILDFKSIYIPLGKIGIDFGPDQINKMAAISIFNFFRFIAYIS